MKKSTLTWAIGLSALALSACSGSEPDARTRSLPCANCLASSPSAREGAHGQPDWVTDWDGAAQPAPDYEGNQRVNW